MHSSSSYLAWFMIYVTLVNLQLWLAFVKPSSLYPDLFLFFFPFELLPAPFFLLFTRSYLDQDPPSLKERMLLFAPFWIFFTGYLYIKWDMLVNDLSYKVAWDKYFPIFKIEEVAALVYGIIIIVVAFQNVLSF
ncbi:MAG: hypothetical protein K0U54_08195, partial [Bacteroidetes bacterium]|nr:hypothetical protein [Bacteroidota bacterium]